MIKYKRGGRMNIDILIKENREKLEQMIMNHEDKQKIVQQSQILDEYINMKMKELVRNQFLFFNKNFII